MAFNPTRVLIAAILVLSTLSLASLPAVAAHDPQDSAQCASTTLPSKVLVSAPPAGSKGPDDIAWLAAEGLDGGRALVWVAYQNGIGADGTPAGAQSTVAGYDPSTGALIKTIEVTGKIDGLTAWQAEGVLIATVNEDDHSAFNLIDPASATVTTYAYAPDPAVAGNGGTDSIAVHGDRIIVSHSNPSDATQATDYLVTLDRSTLTARLTPVFFDDSIATNAVTGAKVKLALTDPDTNLIMPRAGERFGGTLATISQGDGVIVFASQSYDDWGHHQRGTTARDRLTVLALTDDVPGNVPPVDGLTVATARQGTLYVVDNGAGKVYALDTSGCQRGTIFIGEPNDNGNPLVGTLNPWTGHITPMGNPFASPKGLLFVPSFGHWDVD